MTWYVLNITWPYVYQLVDAVFHCLNTFLLACFQEFRGVVGLTGSMDLEPDMTKVPARTVEILASCHALVFVDNKLVCGCDSFDVLIL